jgi:sulfide:quinone oxidoreductase
VRAIDPARRVAILDDQSEMAFDLFLGIPKHCVPLVVEQSGMTEDGWVPVDSRTLQTRFAGVYAIGDVTSVGTPKAGVFAEGAARVVADALIAEVLGTDGPSAYTGAGSCYVEFGAHRVGRVDVDFLSGPSPTGTYVDASTTLVAEKEEFGSSRRHRWFDL